MAMVMQNLGGVCVRRGGGGGGVELNKVHYCLCENGEWRFFFHLSLSNCRISFCLSHKDLTIKANCGSQALSTPSRLRFSVW